MPLTSPPHSLRCLAPNPGPSETLRFTHPLRDCECVFAALATRVQRNTLIHKTRSSNTNLASLSWTRRVPPPSPREWAQTTAGSATGGRGWSDGEPA